MTLKRRLDTCETAYERLLGASSRSGLESIWDSLPDTSKAEFALIAGDLLETYEKEVRDGVASRETIEVIPCLRALRDYGTERQSGPVGSCRS
jgi:hypothetical protein